MGTFEKIIQDFLTAYYNNAADSFQLYKNKIIREIKRDQWQFTRLKNYYLVAKGLYCFLLNDEDEYISIKDTGIIVKLIYYCLLKALLLNDMKYSDNIYEMSQLAIIILCEQSQFLMNGILVGELMIMPNYAQNHIGEQLKLFGGIAKEGDNSNLSENNHLYKRYSQMIEPLNPYLPTGITLDILKQKYMPSLQHLVVDIENVIIYSEDEDNELW